MVVSEDNGVYPKTEAMLKCMTATEGSAQKDPDVPTPPSPIVCRERPNDNARKQTSSLCTAKCESTTDKCSICGIRRLTKCCSAKACLQCCVDTNCLGHKKARANALFRQRVLAKTTPVQQEAARIRSMKISSLRFKEAGFKYIGDTVVIWNLREYCDNPKWRTEAIRKSSRRLKSIGSSRKHLGNSRQRFRRLMDELYADAKKNSQQCDQPHAVPT